MTEQRLKVSNDGSFEPEREDSPEPQGAAAPAQEQSEDSGAPMKQQAQEVAGQAKQQAQQAAGQAKQQAQQAAGQAKDKASAKVDERTTQAGQQVGAQAQAIDGVAEELRRQGKEGPANIAEQASQRVKDAGQYLENADGEQLVNAARDAAQEHPAAAAAVGAAAGFAAGRILKASAPDSADDESGTPTEGGQ